MFNSCCSPYQSPSGDPQWNDCWGEVEPAPDAEQSPLTYTVTAEGVNVETKHATTTPGDSSVTLSSLQELTVYNVSVQAVNSGGPSRSLTTAVRMVTIG